MNDDLTQFEHGFDLAQDRGPWYFVPKHLNSDAEEGYSTYVGYYLPILYEESVKEGEDTQ